MAEPDYEYRGMMAEAWDLLRGDTQGWADRALYLDLIHKYGEPVLDVGCGTGRLLLDFLGQGIDIDGVDNSPEMLAICRRKAETRHLEPALYEQSMPELSLPRAYATILVPSSSFQLLIDPEEARTALGHFYRQLLAGGVLVMPFYINIFDETNASTVVEDWHIHQEAVRPEDGVTVRRWSRITYDLDQKLEYTDDRYELIKDGEILATHEFNRAPATRWYSEQEALNLYQQAGFEVVEALSEFTHEPMQPYDTLFTLVGQKPGKPNRT